MNFLYLVLSRSLLAINLTNKPERMNIFDKTFEKYRNSGSKFESNFTIIAYKLPINSFVEKIQHQLNLINLMSDRFKKVYLYTRLNNFKEYIKNKFETETHITNIFFVGQETNAIDIIDSWKLVIEKFDVESYIFRHGEYFDIAFLQSLLTDDKFYNVVVILPNKLSVFQHNPSKRKQVNQIQVPKLPELITYLKTIKGQCIIHGTSNILASLSTSNELDSNVIIKTKILGCNDLNDIFRNSEDTKNSAQLDIWMQRILHPEYGKRLVFGKDIEKKIIEMQIETIFCSQEMGDKINKRVPDHLKKFKLIVIRPCDDPSKKLCADFNGILGITYY